jgi:hypothetical protein
MPDRINYLLGTLMPIFTTTGELETDYWQADGNIDFAYLPANLIPSFPDGGPIRLHVGNSAHGQKHIDFKHQPWLTKLGLQACEVVWDKLQKPAQIYSSDKQSAFKLSFRFSPEALMVIEWRWSANYFSVVTLYSHPSRIDGQLLGRYKPTYQTQKIALAQSTQEKSRS